jgi:hypothetical protein
MGSSVSALSSVVAKGHQTVHSVSSTPSKIPYGGFSPVWLCDLAGKMTFFNAAGAMLSSKLWTDFPARVEI